MRTDKSYMIVISHFKLYPALFPLKWLICIPNISAVRRNVVFETLHDFTGQQYQKNKSAVICRIGVICVPLLNGEAKVGGNPPPIDHNSSNHSQRNDCCYCFKLTK